MTIRVTLRPGLMLEQIDPTVIKLCEVAVDRARQSAEYLLRHGMFRNGGTMDAAGNRAFGYAALAVTLADDSMG